MTLTTDVHVVPGLTIPVETKSRFFPLSTGLTSAKSLREHSWLPVGVPYKPASALGSKGQAPLCFLRSFSEMLQSIVCMFLGVGWTVPWITQNSPCRSKGRS